MAKSDIEKVLAVFQGIGARDADLATKHMNPKKYIQHNPHASDGVEGLREYIIDLYRVEDGKSAERWGFPAEIPRQEEWKNNNGML